MFTSRYIISILLKAQVYLHSGEVSSLVMLGILLQQPVIILSANIKTSQCLLE